MWTFGLDDSDTMSWDRALLGAQGDVYAHSLVTLTIPSDRHLADVVSARLIPQTRNLRHLEIELKNETHSHILEALDMVALFYGDALASLDLTIWASYLNKKSR